MIQQRRIPQPLAHPEPVPPGPDAAPHAVTPRKILVVDDNVDAANSLSTLLTMSGHATSLAHDGTEALRLATEEEPDLVLLDVGLPGIDGYEVARRVRRLPRLRHTRLIAMTGYGQESDKLAAAEAGFDRHLVKPVDFDVLVEMIERLG